MTDIEVTVVIVTYKVASLTIECLRSLESERGTPGLRIQVVVVDNASGDAAQIAPEIVDNNWESWVTLLTAPKNGGFSYGNNLAIQHACDVGAPDYFHLLNPDTVVRQGAVAALVRFLEGEPGAGIAGSCLENVEGVEAPFAFRFPSILGEIESGMQLGLVTRMLEQWVVRRRMGTNNEPVDWVSGASAMIRRTLFDRIGALDERYFLYFEETDFSRRARKVGFATWYVPASRVMHVAGQSTKLIHAKKETQRLPDYWFESRRLWFVKAYGISYAIAVDVCAVLAHMVGFFKNKILRRELGVPFYIRDLMQHSPVWRRNRRGD
jgi:N-acetylglucosaminyl-diphospho-decaprenol L-rhamnosyltransferase